jgi:hypothetical protein
MLLGDDSWALSDCGKPSAKVANPMPDMTNVTGENLVSEQAAELSLLIDLEALKWTPFFGQG